MADMSEESDHDGSSSNDILLKIQQLEREKAEMEKRREKEMLDKKLKELQKSIAGLKDSSPNTPSASSTRKSQKGDISPSISIPESVFKLKNRLSKSLHSEHEDSDSNNENHSSEEDKEVEEVMSMQHKQKLQKNRDTLVENMIPDDILNDLIAGKVLTSADVNRIKKKSTREEINEELLNNIVLKSERAFYVFTKSLRKTLQDYLANLLDPPPKKKNKRKRQQKEMNVSVDVEDITAVNNRPLTCTCQEVEEQILLLSKNAYKSIRRRDESASSFEQFSKELAATNAVIRDSMEIMNTLKMLCRHGEITGVYRGSIRFTILFSDVQALKKLWAEFHCGELLSSLQSTLVTDQLKNVLEVKDIKLGVRIDEAEYLECLRELSGAKRVMREKEKKKDCPCQDVENSPSPKTLTFQQYGHRKAFNELPKNRESIPVLSNNMKVIECEKCESRNTTSFHQLQPHV